MMFGLNCKYIDVILCLSKVRQYILFYPDCDSEFYYVILVIEMSIFLWMNTLVI